MTSFKGKETLLQQQEQLPTLMMATSSTMHAPQVILLGEGATEEAGISCKENVAICCYSVVQLRIFQAKEAINLHIRQASTFV